MQTESKKFKCPRCGKEFMAVPLCVVECPLCKSISYEKTEEDDDNETVSNPVSE